ncbi:MAG: Mth938-like domain-containing protein, partial [Pseudomonadota bacterium]
MSAPMGRRSEPVRLNEIDFEGSQPPVDGYGPGGFRVAGAWHKGGLLILPGGVQTGDLSPEGIAPLLTEAEGIDVLLIGTGAEIAHLPASLAKALESTQIGVETMSTPSACRTYN